MMLLMMLKQKEEKMEEEGGRYDEGGECDDEIKEVALQKNEICEICETKF